VTGENRADLIGREVEAERHDQGNHRLDEGEDHRRFSAPDRAGLGVHGSSRHFTPIQKAEASSPRSARIAPRRGMRIPGEMS
jgi:hypothetical protein